MKINWRVRFSNPVFIVQLILSVITPIIGYMGIKLEDLTSWAYLGEVMLQAISNPYVIALIAVSVWNALNDPTVSGLSDSKLAQTYLCPKKDEEAA